MALIKSCLKSGGASGDFSALFPMTIGASFSTGQQMDSAGSLNTTGKPFIIPTVGINHLNINASSTSVLTWTIKANDGTTITPSANTDVSAYDYLTVEFNASWFNSSTSWVATFTIVD